MDIPELKPSFSTLVLSIASSAAMSMGLAPNPATQKIEKDLKMAQFNIELLILLKTKTDNNLTEEEQKYLNTVINDLQMKFVQAK
ncbi:MAG: DUF1844 domain-containing protein [Bdellovibrionales bacterium]|nr:DUF1844 domain-containing protein [Bdellovibrionales bacterium]